MTTMTEPKKYEKKRISAKWQKHTDGTYYYKETTTTTVYDPVLGWQKVGEVVKEKTPEETGLCRSFVIDVIFCKDYNDLNEWNGKKTVWFKQSMTYTLRADQTSNIWLKPSNGKLYIKDLEDGLCMEVPLGESSPNLICKQSKPVKIEPSEAQELANTTRYIFNRIESTGNEITAYITTV